MRYYKATFSTHNCDPDILIAELLDIGFDSFEEKAGTVEGYYQEGSLSLSEMKAFLTKKNLPQPTEPELLPEQNWNAKWEENFHPIKVGKELLVRATFHEKDTSVKTELLIDPQMSFGTGHHDTTFQLLERMIQKELTGKAVLDIGCGTGILAIYAILKGAEEVEGVDLDKWAYENAKQNASLNNCSTIKWVFGTVSDTATQQADLVLANINKNVILEELAIYAAKIKRGGELWLSGFFSTDVPDIDQLAASCGLTKTFQTEKNQWAALGYIRSY